MSSTQTRELAKIAADAIAAGAPITVVTKEEKPAPAPAPVAEIPDSEYGAFIAPAPAPVALFSGGVPLKAVIVSVAPNPKKPGSAAHARYALYPAEGSTLADALKAGVTRADFLYDLRKGYLVVNN